MFVVSEKHLFWWPVTVRMPSATEAGAIDENTFEMQFEALPLDKAREIDAERNKLPEAQRDARVFDFLERICRNWRDVVGPDEGAITFTPELLTQQLQFAWFRDAVLAAYEEAVRGEEPRLGNSEAQRAA